MSASSGSCPKHDGQPFAVPVEDFIADAIDAPPPLIGSADDCILPAYGLLLFIAKGGKGKTTATLDAILHLASGRPWLGFEVLRPLRILLIENEGPREPFRRKLERRLCHWSHLPLKGAIHVYDESWGEASLNDDGFVERLSRFVSENEIDLVVGDPLDTLGMEGSGSPKDTREMVERLQDAGLFTRTAWWILHHARKERASDSIDEASGSWGGKPDALLGLEKLSGERARLGFHKLRWARRDGFSYLLDYDVDTEDFKFLTEETHEGQSRDLLAEVAALLKSAGPRTLSEIAERRAGGVGANKDAVRTILEGHPERFVSCTGDEAQALGRKANAIIWELAQGFEPVEPVAGSDGEVVSLAPGLPHREPEPASQPPAAPEKLAQSRESGIRSLGCPSHRDSPARGCRYCPAADGEAAR